MNTLSEMIINKFPSIKTIKSSELQNSGTGYIYPSLHSENVVLFYDCSRLGYMFQIVTNSNGELSKSCFVIHERYPGSDNLVVFSGPTEFYYDDIVRSYDSQQFITRLKSLLKGETIGQWDTSQKNDYEFKLASNDTIDEISDETCKQLFLTVDN
jgi:hypothetical protein